MRVTKVNIVVKGQNKTVPLEFRRDAQGGFLAYDTTEVRGEENICAFLEEHKNDSFNLSILNKTLVKAMPRRLLQSDKTGKPLSRDKEREKKEGLNLKTLESIFNYALGKCSQKKEPQISYLKQINLDELREYFGHKFQKEMSYRPAQGADPVKFDLASDLHAALQDKDITTTAQVVERLTNYINWAKWYKRRKAETLARSIANNAMPIANNAQGTQNTTTQTDAAKSISKRQQALQKLEQSETNGQNRISQLEHNFGLQELCKEWRVHWNGAKKFTQDDLKQKPEEAKKRLCNTPKDYFNFKRDLKLALQKHQKKYVAQKAGAVDFDLLNLYSQEVSKYLALYFPLKTSGKRLGQEDVEHYLAESTVKAALQVRLKNAAQQYRLQQSKLFVHTTTANATPGQSEPNQSEPNQSSPGQTSALPTLSSSSAAQHTKIREVFGLKFFTACAFAANNLRNCLAPKEKNDILGKETLKAALESCLNGSKDEAIKRLYPFFMSDLNQIDFAAKLESTDAFKDFVWALRGSVQPRRNATIHFGQSQTDGKDFYQDMLQVENYEDACGGNKNYVDQPLLCQLLQNDLNNLPKIFGEKLKSDELYTYYNEADIQKAFYQFDLFTRPLAFIPSFKNVFKKGESLQKQKDKYPLNLTHYLKPTAAEDERATAYYNALKLVYEHFFIADFIKPNDSFKAAVSAVLKANKKQAEAKNQKYAWAFHDVPEYAEAIDKSPQEYLSRIQQYIVDEEAKKRERSEVAEQNGKKPSPKTCLGPAETGNFQKFLWQVFLKGFDTFLSKNEEKYGFIAKPALQYKQEDTASQRADYLNGCVGRCTAEIGHSIKPNNNSHLAFWTFCRLLNSSSLNELSNQFSKMLQAEEKNKVNTGYEPQIRVLQEIITLCLLNADNVPQNQPGQRSKDEHLKHLKSYVQDEVFADVSLYVPLYFQEDNETPVLHAGVELCHKYATAQILSQVLKSHALTKTCVEKWKNLRNDNSAAEWSAQRENLHKAWVAAKEKGNENETEWIEQNIKPYRELCQKLDEWNWLDNQVHLVHVRDLHNLLISILGRFMGFAALFERDFRFYNHWLCNNNNNNSKFKVLEDDLSIFNFPTPQKDLLYATFLDKANVEFTLSNGTSKKEPDDGTGKTWKDKRNYIAHLNYLTQGGEGVSILDMLFYLRALLGYDRKLKNAVAKSFITLLNRHGIAIEFEPLHKNSHQFNIAKIEAKTITHLGGKKPKAKKSDPKPAPETVVTFARHKNYVEMVKALLEYKI